MWWVPVLAVLAAVSGCAKNLATGRNQFNVMSMQQEVQMGLSSKQEIIEQFQGAVPDAQLQAYLTDLGRRLSQVTEGDSPRLPWSFTLLNSDIPNAFALPGGQVFVTRGLAKRLTNEAQLAGVVGHEIGHVTARHGGERISKQLGFEVIVKGLGAGTGSPELEELSGQVAQITLMSYSRDQEHESDSLGVRYMSKLGYNPIGQVQVMELFAKMQAASGSKPSEWTSTHPDPANRVKRLRDEISRSYAATQKDPKYKLNEAEYRSKMLGRLALLPPPPDADAPETRLAIARLGDHGTWCAHCAAAEKSR